MAHHLQRILLLLQHDWDIVRWLLQIGMAYMVLFDLSVHAEIIISSRSWDAMLQ
jgi:hypothetical protein